MGVRSTAIPLLFLGLTSCSDPPPYSCDPRAFMREVELRGPSEVLDELDGITLGLCSLMDGVYSADPEWLAAAGTLRPHVSDDLARRIDRMLFLALELHPEEVFSRCSLTARTEEQPFLLREVCSPFRPERSSTEELTHLRATIAVLSRAEPSEYIATCLEALADAENELLQAGLDAPVGRSPCPCEL